MPTTLQLKNYQLAALARLRTFLEEARLDTNPARAFEKVLLEATGREISYRPVADLPHLPSVCLRLPTGGGKTILGAAAVGVAAETYRNTDSPLVLWLVHSDPVRVQTRKALLDPHHPYRLALGQPFGGRVRVFDIADFVNIRPQDLKESCCVVISTMAALNVNNPNGRKVYAHNENLEPHFTAALRAVPHLQLISEGEAGAGTPRFSFANLLKVYRPIVIVDEAQNFATSLSDEVKTRIAPSVVIELTATPHKNSNVLFRVSAAELKEDDMIKLPIVLGEHLTQWQDTVSRAVATRKRLAAIAVDEPAYIRPILLVQCENAGKPSDWQAVKQYLLESEHLAEAEIAIHTGTTRQLDGLDLFSPDCPVTTILTVQALAEGWDCSFAYVLCSTANIGNPKDIEQLLGRVLRMPYATKRKHTALNKAYAHVSSKRFGDTALSLKDALIHNGFEPEETQTAIVAEQENFFPLEGFRQPLIQTLEAPPDLSALTEVELKNVTLTDEGGEFRLVARGPLPEPLTAQLHRLAPAEQELELVHRIALHNLEWSPSLSEQGILFAVPRLSVEIGQTLRLFDPDLVEDEFEFNLDRYPADLAGFSVEDITRFYSLDTDGRRIGIAPLGDIDQFILPGTEASPDNLTSWLNRRVRIDQRLSFAQLDAWIRKAVLDLIAGGANLSDLYHGKFLLLRTLAVQLRIAEADARKAAYQTALFSAKATRHEFDFQFQREYLPHWLYMGRHRFQKHFYPRPGELKDKGTEFDCAVEIDRMEQVEFWVRNLAPPPDTRSQSSFWLYAPGRRFYPDFVARLKDGRTLVVEFKGQLSDKAQVDRELGKMWAERSGGKAIFLMAFNQNERGWNVRDQLRNAIG